MGAHENLEAVRQLHNPEQAGRLYHDLLFELLAEDVEWQALGPEAVFPWAGTHRGRAAVRQWFDSLNELMDYERFEPLELYADGDAVIEVISAAGRARASGLPFASEVVRVWTFRGGQARKVRSYYDTYAYAAALERASG